jgi:hypothetical protein
MPQLEKTQDNRLSEKFNVGIMVGTDVKYLDNCIKSVFDYANKIYVLDTKGILEGWLPGVKNISNIWNHYSRKIVLCHYNWNYDFADARNKLLEMIPNNSWTLMIDPDERFILGKNVSPIPKVETGIDGFNINIMGPHTYENKSNFINSKFTRLFWKTSKTMYTSSVHEQVSPSIEEYGGKIAEVPPTIMKIVHLGYDIIWEEMEKKLKRNFEIMELIRLKNPMDSTNNLHLAKHYSMIKDYPRAKILYEDSLKNDMSDSNRGFILNELGTMALIRKDMKDAVKYFMEGVEYGNVNCIYNMGKINIWSPNMLTIQKGVKMLSIVIDNMFINKDECKKLLRIGNENYMNLLRKILKENK